MRPSSMPMDEASSAQARRPSFTNCCKCACKDTASGVVMPVARSAAKGWADSPSTGALACGGWPTPSVPSTAQGCASAPGKALSACASHQAVEVLPLVPVIAITESCCEGWSKNASAIAPASAFRPVYAATRVSVRPKAGRPSASTRQAPTPWRRAWGTNWRPSTTAPGVATKPSPAPRLRLSLPKVPVTCVRSHWAACWGVPSCRAIKSSPALRWP